MLYEYQLCERVIRQTGKWQQIVSHNFHRFCTKNHLYTLRQLRSYSTEFQICSNSPKFSNVFCIDIFFLGLSAWRDVASEDEWKGMVSPLPRIISKLAHFCDGLPKPLRKFTMALGQSEPTLVFMVNFTKLDISTKKSVKIHLDVVAHSWPASEWSFFLLRRKG